MPYTIEMRDDKHCVVKINPDNTTETITCHDTHEQAVAHLQALEANVSDAKHKPIKHIGDSVKALADNRVGGYLVRFTDDNNPDLTGEYFNANTDFWLERGYPVKGAPILIEHGFDDAFKVMPVGILEFVDERDAGLWVEGKLHDRQAYEDMLRKMRGKKQIDWTDERISKQAQLIESTVKAFFATDKVQWSSGALPQSVEVDNGHIKSWAIIEGTGTISPAEPNGTEIALLKSAFKELQHSLSIQSDEPVNGRKGATEHKGATNTGGAVVEPDAKQAIKADTDKQQANNEGQIKMSKDDMLALLSQLAEAITEFGMESGASEDDAIAMTEEVMDKMENLDEEEVKSITPQAIAEKAFALLKAKIDEQKRDAKSARDAFNAAATDWKKSQPATSNLPNYSPRNQQISVGENLKYAHLDADAMALGYMLLESGLPKAMRGRVQAASDEYIRHMTQKAVAANERRENYVDKLAVKSAMPFKADEIDATNISGQGQDWVGVFYGTNLWEKARNETIVLRELERRGAYMTEIPQGSGSAVIPTEGSDPTAYSTPQANDLDSTGRVEVTANVNYFGTGSVTMTPGQIKIAAAATDELVEDSVIPILQNMSRQMQIKALETIDQALINGDSETAANTNINLIDGTPGTGISRPYYLAVNGLRKYPLVTNTAYSRDAGALTIDDFRLLLAEFTAPVQVQLDKLFFLMDVFTHNTALALPEIATDDVRRTNATISSGRIMNVYGVDNYVTGFLEKSNSAGKIPAAGGTLGQILAVYAPYWAFGWKRNVRLDTDYDPLSGVTYAVASMRFGFNARGADASAIAYNITIA